MAVPVTTTKLPKPKTGDRSSNIEVNRLVPLRRSDDWKNIQETWKTLLAPGMRDGAFIKHVIRPSLLLYLYGRRGFRRRRSQWITLRRYVPIFRRICNPPHISMCVQRSADQKITSIFSQGNATGHARRHASTSGQTAEHERSLNLQFLGTLEPASLRAHYQQRALLAKWTPAIEADDAYRNLNSHSCAATDCLWR
jgi:hypothetical protein